MSTHGHAYHVLIINMPLGGKAMDQMLLTIPAAIGLGALHSLEPGHGKGVMSAYLVSSRSSVRDAILMGCTAALSHTFSILILAFIANTMMHGLPEQLQRWIELVSGGVITLLGVKILGQQLFPPVVTVGRIGHPHGSVCAHGHVHTWDSPDTVPLSERENGSLLLRKRRLLTLGAFTGLIPCPSALAILLASLAAQKIYAGFTLVLAFSLGSAITMSTLGVLILKASRSLVSMESGRFTQALAILSSLLIISIGGLVLYRALLPFS
jgi:nickel/cobalt transporter (NicO) family protein